MKLSTEQVNYKEEELKVGWLCPRCGKINSPFVQQCNCSPFICRYTKSDSPTITATLYH